MEVLLSPRTDEAIAGSTVRRSDVDRDQAESVEDDPWRKDHRSRAEHDRDRVLYSAAFQRLAYVTQVTAPESGHVFHNRLSHSLKVAQVGRRNAERLRALAHDGAITGAAATLVASIQPDAVEASCLAHDLGHPPFGHIAEYVLDEKASRYMPEKDGFEGNAQSFRIITRLAQRASGGGGLDLTRQTLDGALKYPWRHWEEDPQNGTRESKWGYYVEDYDAYKFARDHAEKVEGGPVPEENGAALPERSIEARIMDWADDLTYAVHDVDDFYRAGLIPLHRLVESEHGEEDDEIKRLRELLHTAKTVDPKAFAKWDVEPLVEAIKEVAAGNAPTGAYRHTKDLRREMRAFGSDLITRYLSVFTVHDDPASGKVKLKIEEFAEREVAALKMLVRVYAIQRPGLAVVQHGQQRMMEDLFEFYFTRSERDRRAGGDRRVFPPGARERLEAAPNEASHRARIVTDFIAGMTEDVAAELYRRITGRESATTLDATTLMG